MRTTSAAAFAALVTLALLTARVVTAFQTPFHRAALVRRLGAGTDHRSLPSSLRDEAAALKAQAEQMRLEAEKLDVALTLHKIGSLESKLNDKAWLKRHPEEEAILSSQWNELQRKLQGEAPRPVVATRPFVPVEPIKETLTVKQPTKVDTKKDDRRQENPLAGFDPDDLVLYLPIAQKIEKALSTATVAEKLEAFQTAPELQDHFQKKIQALLVGPMEDLQRLESLKHQYLASTSSVEKDQLKREIDKLEILVENESPFLFCDSVYKELPELTEEEIQTRIQAIQELPPVLQSLYKKRNNVEEEDDIRLAIEVEHFAPQIQLLDQIRFVAPLDRKGREQAIRGYNSLPQSVKDQFSQANAIEVGLDAAAVIKALEGDNASWGASLPFQDVVEAANIPDPPEYNDIEFVDRSRYVEEFIPAFARMEDLRPTEQDIDMFVAEILDRTTYTLVSKPERVVGGYYLRGENKLKGEEANDMLVKRLQEKLNASSLKDKIQFFYIPDPTPPTDEDIESGSTDRPLLAVTSKNAAEFYNWKNPLWKPVVSTTGVLSTVIFALGACGMNGATTDRLDASMNAGNYDISWLTDMAAPIVVSMLGIQLVHEVAHRVVALKDKFDVGLPNLVPSLQLGLTGAITPLKSPPKNWKSMFDFSLAGPIAGIVVSLFLLFSGLGATAAMDFVQQEQLPALPITLLRESSLGGGLIEAFLGKGVLGSATTDASVLPLHPFAIAGYVGLISSALSLLPLGHTDGGRVALAMFGRRGTFLVKSFSSVLLATVGFFGFDHSKILLLYALFSVVFQRELESPVLNEVDELDVTRGFIGIASALLVALVLIPLT